MKIVVWGINYAPEQTGIAPYNTAMCEHLAAAGHEVTMATTFPYYPEWRKRPGDRGRLFREERCNGVRILRCWHYVPSRPTALKRMIHEATFVGLAWLRLLLGTRPDIVVVVSPPLLLGAAARVLCSLRRTRYWFHVQDMQPDAAVRLGLLRPGKLTRILYAFERLAYRHAVAVSGITPGMLDLFSEKGVPAAACRLFPNWTGAGIRPREATGEFRARHGIGPRALLAVYSGNLGKKQGLDILIRAAEALRLDPAGAPVRIVIAGDGVEKASLARQVDEAGLTNVLVLPLQPADAYAAMLADADVCLVTQQAGSGALFFPSKLLSILAAGRAVVAVCDPDGELDRAVASGGFGWAIRTGEDSALGRLLRELGARRTEIHERAARGLTWVEQFSAETVLQRFEIELREAASQDRRKRLNP